MSQAWLLYERHGRWYLRVYRETRALFGGLAYVILWAAVGMVLIMGSYYVWGGE